MFNCIKCNKTYKSKPFYDKHILVCNSIPELKNQNQNQNSKLEEDIEILKNKYIELENKYNSLNETFSERINKQIINYFKSYQYVGYIGTVFFKNKKVR